MYIFWGSTYLAIRVGIENFPPFALGSVRFVLAGAILCAFNWRNLRAAMSWVHWRSAFVLGFLMLIGGNGGVIIGERTIPSGIASLLVALVPFWLVLLDAARQRRLMRPLVIAGLLVGFLGVGLLVNPSPSQQVDLGAAGIIMAGGVMWAVGSLYSRSAPQAEPALAAVGMEMLAGGMLFAVLSVASGEPGHFHWTPTAIWAILWLVCAGSLIGFTGYIYALRTLPTATVSTYAFVNPLIAVLLGWALLGEAVTAQTALAMGTTVVGVVLILLGRSKVTPASQPPEVAPS